MASEVGFKAGERAVLMPAKEDYGRWVRLVGWAVVVDEVKGSRAWVTHDVAPPLRRFEREPVRTSELITPQESKQRRVKFNEEHGLS